MKNLMINDFKRLFKSLILWTVIVGGLALLMLLLFPAFEDIYADLEALLEGYPQGFLEAFGLGEGGLIMEDIYGWFGVEGYLFVLLIGSVYAGLLGGSILSKEEDDQTIEFLLTRPITRSEIYGAKLGVIVINLVLLNSVVAIVLGVTFAAFDTMNWTVWALFSVGPLILHLIFASVSLLISVFVTKSRTVTSIALGLVVGLYVLDIISALTDSVENLKYITPYEYVNAITIVNEGRLEPLYMAISAGIITFALLAGWGFYRKKDIAA
jgi:ABC-2 type transport system permease protein